MTTELSPEEQLRAAYRERAHLAALLAAIYPSTLGYTDPDEPDWPVLYVNLPTGLDPGPTVERGGMKISSVDLDLLRHRWYSNGAGYLKRQSHLPTPRGYLHRVIAERIWGQIPDGFEVDHIDRDRGNNSRWNLRLATPHVQKLNQDRCSVRLRKSGRWQAMYEDAGRQVSYGTFDTREEAARASASARSEAISRAIANGEVITWTLQCSWHIAPDDVDLFGHVERDDSVQWDGHTTDEKYARIQRLAETRTADPDRLAVLRAWLTGEAAKLRRNSECAGVLEVEHAVGGEVVGYERAARLIDRLMAGLPLPVTGGPAVESADGALRDRYAEAVHNALRDYGEGDYDPGTGSDYGDQTAVVLAVRDTELAQLRAQVAGLSRGLAEADTDWCEAANHNDATCEAVAERDRLRAQVAAARQFAKEMRGYCSPHGVSVEYADRLDARLDAAAEAGR